MEDKLLEFNTMFKRAVSGDKDAQEGLYLSLNNSVLKVIKYLVKKRAAGEYVDTSIVDDMFQDFWVYFYSKLLYSEKIDFEKNIRSYIITAAFLFFRHNLYKNDTSKISTQESLTGDKLIIYLLDKNLGNKEIESSFVELSNEYYSSLSNDDKYIFNHLVGDITRAKVREITGRSNDYITNHKNIIINRLEKIYNEVYA